MEKFPSRDRPDTRTHTERVTDTIAVTAEKARERIQAFIGRLEKKLNLINTVSWSEKDFDIESALTKRSGPFIEVGGPTAKGFDLVSSRAIKNSGKGYYTSNINDGHYIHRGFADRRRLVRVAPVDFAADTRRLPLKDASIGALFAAYLPQQVRAEAMAEAKRVLESGGLLVWQGAATSDFSTAQEQGLRLVSYEWQLPQEITDAIPEGVNLSDPVSLRPTIVELAKEKMTHWLILNDIEEMVSLPTSVKEGRDIHFADAMVPDACIFEKI